MWQTDIAVSVQSLFISIKNYNRTSLFNEMSDYHFCLNKLKTSVDKYGCQLHAYALLPNQILLFASSEQGVPAIHAIEQFERGYEQYSNFTYRRLQSKLELHYSMVPVDTERHVLTYYRYIELAPLRAGLTEHPADYPWSSYGHNAMGEDAGLVVPHPRYLQLGLDDESRRQMYRQLCVLYPASVTLVNPEPLRSVK